MQLSLDFTPHTPLLAGGCTSAAKRLTPRNILNTAKYKKNERRRAGKKQAGLQVDFASDNQPLIKPLQIRKVARFQGAITRKEIVHIIEHVC